MSELAKSENSAIDEDEKIVHEQANDLLQKFREEAMQDEEILSSEPPKMNEDDSPMVSEIQIKKGFLDSLFSKFMICCRPQTYEAEKKNMEQQYQAKVEKSLYETEQEIERQRELRYKNDPESEN